MNRKDLKLARTFKKKLHARLPDAEVTAYGSRARGDHHRYSDLDLFVLVNRYNRKIRGLVFDCAWQVGFDAGIHLSTTIYTRKEIAGVLKEDPLYLNVQREGVPI